MILISCTTMIFSPYLMNDEILLKNVDSKTKVKTDVLMGENCDGSVDHHRPLNTLHIHSFCIVYFDHTVQTIEKEIIIPGLCKGSM